jgi:hypothetical protein
VVASAGAFIDGLLSGISRKTGWLMAEQAGLDPGPFNALIFGGLGRVSPKCHTPKPTALG